MRDYEKYKNELRKYMSIVRSGSNNGTYGFHWYTNYITGDYKLLKPPVTEEWIRGHHFYGEFCSISNNPNYRYKKVSNSLKEFYKNKTTKKEFKHPSKNYRKLTYFNPITLDKIKCKNKNIPKGYIKYERIFYTILYTQKLWDEYHSNNYKALSEFTKYSTWNAVAIKFNKYIPLYKKLGSIKQAGFPSNPDLIGKYE